MPLTFHLPWLGWLTPGGDLQGVAIGITVVGQRANLKASAIQIGDIVERDGQAVIGMDHHRHGRLGPCPSIAGLKRELITAVDIGVGGIDQIGDLPVRVPCKGGSRAT